MQESTQVRNRGRITIRKSIHEYDRNEIRERSMTGLHVQISADKAEMQAVIKARGDSDLVACLIDKRISLEVQFKPVRGGITTLGRLAGIEDNRDAFRKTIAEIAEIDPKDGAPAKLVLSDLVEAWMFPCCCLRASWRQRQQQHRSVVV